MILKFERWLYSQNIPEDANELFKESIICYKVSAYRAALILSYLGFQMTLKDRVLSIDTSTLPDAYTIEGWRAKVINDLDDQNLWDNKVHSITQMRDNKAVFLIDDDLRQQVVYWRNRRNDCAHAKDNKIDSSHVECFWLFLESNMNKFVVNGGKNGLLDKIKKHFDLAYTPPGEDPLYLINQIPLTMRKSEIATFFNEVYDFFSEMKNIRTASKEGGEVYKFWLKVINHENFDCIQNSFISFIKSDMDIFCRFLKNYPDILYKIIEDKDFMRQFWVSEFFERHYGAHKWRIVEIILKNNVIPEAETDIFMKKLALNTINPPIEMIELLTKFNYFLFKKRYLFESGKISELYTGINFANNHWNQIKFYIENIGLDEIVVRELNSAYLAAHFGTFYDGLTRLLEDKNIAGIYKDILVANHLPLPEVLSEEEGDNIE